MSNLSPEARSFFAKATAEMDFDNIDSVYRVAACYICGIGTEHDTVKGADLLNELVIPESIHEYEPARPDQCFKEDIAVAHRVVFYAFRKCYTATMFFDITKSFA